MPVDLGLPKFYKWDETPVNTLCVSKGQYIGEVMGKYGAQYRFRQLEDHQEVVIGGGQLKWRVAQGHIVPGDVLDITYLGKEVLERGQFKGKDSINFKFEKYSKAEIAALGLEADDIPDSAAAVSEVPAAVVAGAVAAPAEPLDDLE